MCVGELRSLVGTNLTVGAQVKVCLECSDRGGVQSRGVSVGLLAEQVAHLFVVVATDTTAAATADECVCFWHPILP